MERSEYGNRLNHTRSTSKSLREQYPNLVKNYYRWDGITSNVSKGDKRFREGLQICDSTCLKCMDFDCYMAIRQSCI